MTFSLLVNLYVQDIRNQNVCDLDLDLYNGTRSNADMPIERTHDFLFDAMVIFA